MIQDKAETHCESARMLNGLSSTKSSRALRLQLRRARQANQDPPITSRFNLLDDLQSNASTSTGYSDHETASDATQQNKVFNDTLESGKGVSPVVQTRVSLRSHKGPADGVADEDTDINENGRNKALLSMGKRRRKTFTSGGKW